MNARNLLMDELLDQARQKLEDVADSPEYKHLLSRLLLQGLVKLIENVVYVKCRPQDRGVIESVIPQATAQFKEMFTQIDQDALARRLKEREGRSEFEEEDDEDFEGEAMPNRDVKVHFIEELTEKDQASLKQGGLILYNET